MRSLAVVGVVFDWAGDWAAFYFTFSMKSIFNCIAFGILGDT
jgi:hypothetical protein